MFVFAVLLNRFCTGRQAKELFNYWQKPTQTRLKKGEKRAKTRESRFSFCSFFSISFFHAVAQEHCMFCGGAFCAWRRIASLVFAAHIYLCAGKAMHWFFSLCANETRRTKSTVQGRLINDGTLVLGAEQGAHIFCVRLGSMRA